jgi:hypothetical protein
MHTKNTIHELIREFYPYAKKKMGFKESCRVFLREDADNYSDPLGKTAYYDPNSKEIHLYTQGRHPKDVLRSFSHELVHHAQNCRGDFADMGPTTEGYAQTDKHLREMEKEAYLEGNLMVRDWCDTRNGLKQHRGMGSIAGSIPQVDTDSEWVGPAGVRKNNGKSGGWTE